MEQTNNLSWILEFYETTDYSVVNKYLKHKWVLFRTYITSTVNYDTKGFPYSETLHYVLVKTKDTIDFPPEPEYKEPEIYPDLLKLLEKN